MKSIMAELFNTKFVLGYCKHWRLQALVNISFEIKKTRLDYKFIINTWLQQTGCLSFYAFYTIPVVF